MRRRDDDERHMPTAQLSQKAKAGLYMDVVDTKKRLEDRGVRQPKGE